MKKLIMLLIVVLALLGCMAGPAVADWSITVNWTRSAGPGLASEAVLLDAATKCTINATDPTTCNFTVPALTGQAVKIRSSNAQGAYSETAPVILSAAPAPASGLLVNITYIAP